MKLNRHIKAALLALVGLALAGSPLRTQAQTIITNSYTNTFDTGGTTSNFSGSGSVASWIYWYNSPGGNLPITNNISMDAGGNPASGSLEVYSPFAGTLGVGGTGATQNRFFGTFGNQYGYDFSVEAKILVYSNLACDIKVDPTMVPFTNATTTNFGTLEFGFINSGYGYDDVGGVTIPASASNGWVHLSIPLDPTSSFSGSDEPGIALTFANYGGYPNANFRFWLDNVALIGSTAPPPLPPILLPYFQTPVLGLNSIGTSKSSYQRYQVCTVNDTGYSFVGQPSVTYTWTVTSFPTNSDWQQHIFFVNGAGVPINQYDQAADYNLGNCIFMTVQSAGPGQPATFNFRYKTNEPGGNTMLFNTNLPTAAANTNGWPVMPVATLTNTTGPLGTWSVNFAQNTNVTITDPSGGTTSFVLDPASAALFADPMYICVGGQDNSQQYFGEYSVISNFTVTGSATALGDNFATDPALDTTTWTNLSNDTNGLVLVPPGSAFWLDWSLPDAGYSLQTSASLSGTPVWTSLASLGTILNYGNRQVLLAKTNLPSAKMGYFQLAHYTFSQLQVLLPGETAAPGTLTGKTGTPTTQNTENLVNVTVNAVDAHFNPIPGISDAIQLGSSDGAAILPNPANLANGTVTFTTFLFQTDGTQNVTATDNTSTNIPVATSSSVTVAN